MKIKNHRNKTMKTFIRYNNYKMNKIKTNNKILQFNKMILVETYLMKTSHK